MYSFGIILQELIFAQGPAFTAEIISVEEKVARMLTNELILVKQNFSGVQLTRFQRERWVIFAFSYDCILSMERCLHPDPGMRYQSAACALADMNTRGLVVKRDVVEIMLDTLEYYSRDLERQISAKKVEYERERQRADDINFMNGEEF